MSSRCEVCGAPAEFECKRCGRKVCTDDYIKEKGICAVCEETLCRLCGRRLAVGYCAICGRLVCKECSIKRGRALICRDCVKATF